MRLDEKKKNVPGKLVSKILSRWVGEEKCALEKSRSPKIEVKHFKKENERKKWASKKMGVREKYHSRRLRSNNVFI